MTSAATSRRTLLKSAALGGGAAVLSGCGEVNQQIALFFGEAVPAQLVPPAAAEIDPDFHLLSRAAYGPWPGELAQL